MSKRSLHIDTLRGLACILLVTYHVIGSDTNSGLRIPEGDPLRLFNDSLAYMRMPLFSFLSGFVYAWRPFDGDTRRFVIGKVKRLLIPMLLVGTLFAVLQANMPGANHTQYDWRTLHVIPVAHFWFLESLFIIFILVAALERLRWLEREGSFVVVWLTAVAIHLIDPLPVYLGMLGAVYLVPYFLLGVWCNRFGRQWPNRNVLMLTVAVGLAASALTVFAYPGLPSRNSPVALMLGVSGCLFLQCLPAQSKFLAWIGVHSFAIYLFHTMFSAASRIGIYELGEFPIVLLMTVGVLAGVAGPILTESLLHRVPSFGSWVLGESLKLPAVPRATKAGVP
jgi:fucose 4-O-acetylase-like acetyltransferase